MSITKSGMLLLQHRGASASTASRRNDKLLQRHLMLINGSKCAQDVSNDLWIIGVIAAAALVLSCVMSLIYFLFSLCGGAGSHICCAAVPVGYALSALLFTLVPASLAACEHS